jgi:hypothetical protein
VHTHYSAVVTDKVSITYQQATRVQPPTNIGC